MKIEIEKLSKEFKGIEVLKDVNLEFEKGKIYGMFGRNGSGKSVFIKLLCSYYLPTKGKVLINGKDYSKNSEYPNNIGVLINSSSFYGDISGFENLVLLSNIQKKIGKEEILKSIDIVNLNEDKDKNVKKYSLGMKQKLGIAQALMENPDIIVLDEPFNGIERTTVNKIKEYLKSIKDDKIIIVSSHIKEDLESLSDEYIYFDNGNVSIVKDLKSNDI